MCGPSWGHVGRCGGIWEPCRGYLYVGPAWAQGGRLGAVQKTVKHSIFCHSPCWCQDGPCWGLLKQSWTCWGRVGAKLGPSWAHVGLGACGDNRSPPVQHRVFYRSAVGSQDRWCWDFWGSTWAMLVAISGDALCRWASWAHEPFLANVGPRLRPTFMPRWPMLSRFVLAVFEPCWGRLEANLLGLARPSRHSLTLLSEPSRKSAQLAPKAWHRHADT